jgi:hypothetical protein
MPDIIPCPTCGHSIRLKRGGATCDACGTIIERAPGQLQIRATVPPEYERAWLAIGHLWCEIVRDTATVWGLDAVKLWALGEAMGWVPERLLDGDDDS